MRIDLRPNDRIHVCPKCANNQRFAVKTAAPADAPRQLWVECACGFDPTDTAVALRHEFEDENDGITPHVRKALAVWNIFIERIALAGASTQDAEGKSCS